MLALWTFHDMFDKPVWSQHPAAGLAEQQARERCREDRSSANMFKMRGRIT